MSEIPSEMLETPIRDWQLNVTTLLVAFAFVGRGYKALRSGGGLVGLWRGVMFGENAPDKNNQPIQK
jgi:hypothetical protein